MTIIARIISVLFHPLLLVTYMFSLFAFTFPLAFEPLKEENAWNFVLIIFGVTFVLPVINIALFKVFGTIRSFSMQYRQERVLPFSFIAILYCVITYLFYTKTRVGLSDNLLKFMFIVDVLVIVATVVTFFYKISVHSLAIWGLIGVLFPLNKMMDSGVFFYPTLGAIALAGIVMTARMQLNAHNLREVMVGGMFGFAAGFLSMVVLF